MTLGVLRPELPELAETLLAWITRLGRYTRRQKKFELGSFNRSNCNYSSIRKGNMNIRNILLLAGLAAFLAGCVINPRPVAYRDYDQRYDDDYYDYRSTPSYEGYYYARIIFIRNVPYYVDDDRYIRPIPPRLHDHFRRYPYNTLGRPPVFSRDNEVRDGYRMSRIIYLDGVPYHVENDHIAQPLPERLQQRFRYTPPANQGNAPANGNRPQPSNRHDDGRNNEPSAYGQDRGRDRDRDERGPNGRERDRIEQPPVERGQREGGSNASADSEGRTTAFPDRRGLPSRQDQPNAGESRADTTSGTERDRIGQPPAERGRREGGSDASANSEGRATPFSDRRRLLLRQDQPKAGESQADTTSGKQRDRDGNRPQAIDDTGKKKADENKADKRKSRFGKKDKPDDSGNKKDKQGDGTQADDDSGDKKDNGKKPRRWKDNDQEGNDRGNSNRRD